MPEGELPMVVIVGPTAVGKTAVAVEVARQLGGEIISADSRLFYRGMDIGTAKPSQSERQGIPHHLIDVIDPNESFSLAVFQSEVERLIDEIRLKNEFPILVGGTGQYALAIIEGWHPPEVSPDPGLRAILNNWATEIGGNALHDRLAVLDPVAANSIDPRNLRRTIRALEVIFTTGERFSDLRRKVEPPADQILIGLICPRVELYRRIDQRIERMISVGLVAEVKELMDRGYTPDLPSMSAIGYREIVQHLQGQIGLDEAILLMKRRTRQFVRRQAAWFKLSDPRIHWIVTEENTALEMVEYIKGRLTRG